MSIKEIICPICGRQPQYCMHSKNQEVNDAYNKIIDKNFHGPFREAARTARNHYLMFKAGWDARGEKDERKN